MLTPPLACLATVCLALLFLTIGGGQGRPSSNTEVAPSGLVVHEWGTFTSVVSQHGESLTWRPLSFESYLPSFVYSVDQGSSWRGNRPSHYPTKSYRPVTVRMETPVLYFYSDEQMTVKVKVSFPGGDITEWYPQARSAGDRGIDWGKLTVMPGAKFSLPRDFRKTHYYPARETDAALLRVRNGKQTEHEKFLFYRGVGGFGLPLSVKLEGNSVAIRNAYEEKVKQAVVFENRGGAIGYRIVDLPEDEIVVERPAPGDNLQELRQEMKAMLMANGLFEKEADAMLNTWRDSWFEEGLRVFYIMPRKTTDAILPIVIEPEPEALVRVLVGRTEVITPEMEQSVTKQISRLRGRSISGRKAARKEINKYGRFLESILQQILNHSTDHLRTREVERLLDEIN